jgi:hypothetical protein
MTEKKKAIIFAYENGYRVKDGNVYYRDKITPRKLFLHYKKKTDKLAYYSFGIRYEGKRVELYVHQLAAYQKYGDDFLNNNLVVNHRDNNTLNNLEDNIIMVLPSGRTRLNNESINSNTSV